MAQKWPDPEQIPEAMWERMGITKERFLEIRAVMLEREARAPANGSPAPDFDLERLSPEGERTSDRERLSDHRGRPVALIFGSYT